MPKIKQNKKQRKKQRFSLLSVVSIVMIGVLCLGMLSSFGGLSSGKINSEKSEIIKDQTNDFGKDEITDVMNGSDYVSMLINKELTTPKNAKEVVSIDFSSAASTYDNINQIPGMKLPNSLTSMNYGHLTAEKRYLEFYTDKGTNNYDYNAWFGFGFHEYEDGSMLHLSTSDYLVVDFDVWTNSEFFDSMMFFFKGQLNGESASDSKPRLSIQNTENGTFIDGKLIEDTTYPLHITYVVKLNHGQKSDTYTYINGEFHSNTLNTHLTFGTLDYLRVDFEKYHENAGRSVCFDNVQIMTFGNGNETYSGSISTCFKDTSIKLQNVSDSVLYEPTKQDEQ